MVNILETGIQHVFDIAYIRDASTRYLGDQLSALVTEPLSIRIVDMQPLKKLQLVQKPGILVFNLPETAAVIKGSLSDTQKQRPVMDAVEITLSVTSDNNQFFPRLIRLNLGSQDSNNIIWLYPHIKTFWGNNKALFGRVVLEDKTPVPWALLKLTVEYQPSRSRTIYAQADANGDFDIPLTSLPGHPKNITSYDTRISVKVPLPGQLSSSASSNNPDEFVVAQIGIKNKPQTQPDLNPEIEFQTEMSIALKPDERTRLLTESHSELVIKH